MHTLIRSVASGSLLLLTAFASASCSGDAGVARSVELTAKDSGSTAQLQTSDELVITLDSNVTTGFAWKLATEPDPKVLELVSSDYVAPETTLVGAGGQEVWTFRATGDGTTELTLSYERSSGETAGEPFTVTVEVAPAG
jgi:inhibitor of cysteine peptidase